MLHGFEHNEDAVILRTPPAGMALVQTVDVLIPLGNNPRLGIVFKQLADMTEKDRQAIADRAGYIRLHLNDL